MKKILSAWLAGSIFLIHSFAFAPAASANPVFIRTENGNIQIEIQGKVYNIYSSDRSIGAFSDFSNAADETINSIQTSSEHSVLFRVDGGNPSQILGAFNANSHVFLVNPNGILFGPGSQVNAPALVVSGLNITNENFLSQKYLFEGSRPGGGYVLNQGNISGKYIALIGKAVRNEGTISAEGGKAVMAAGDRVTLSIDGGGLVSVAIDQAVSAPIYDFQGKKINEAIANTGTIEATGGKVVLSAKAAEEIFDTVINHTGVIRAKSVTNKNGVIELLGGDEGVVQVTGTLDASGKEAGQKGGTIHVLGDKVGLFSGASVDASGDTGGGTVLVGGDYKGENSKIQNAEAVYFDKNASIKADALSSGQGGEVILWSDNVTKAYGSISAKGGALGGPGGFVETSSKNYLNVEGARVIAKQWLLDPYDVTITSGASTNGSFSGTTTKTWTATGTSTILNTDINASLIAGTNVTITTAGAGTDNGDITVNGAITKTGANVDATLTLNATRNITVNQNITSTTGSGKLHVNLTAGGNDTFNAAVATNGGNFTSAGVTFDNTAAAGTITTGSGNVTISHTGDITTGAAITSGGNVAISTSGGDILITNGPGTPEISAGGTIAITASGDDKSIGIQSGANVYSTGGTHTYTADKMAITGTITATGQTVILKPNEAGEAINMTTLATNLIGDTLELSDAELDQIDAGALTIGSNTAGAILFSDDFTQGAKNIDLVTNTTINDSGSGGAAITTTGNLVLAAQTGIGTTGAFDVDTPVVASATTGTGGISLNLRDTDAGGVTLTLADATTSGDIVLTGTVGAQTRTYSKVDTNNGAITITSAGHGVFTDIRSDTGVSGAHDITLTGTTGDVTLGVIESDHNVSITANGGDIVDGNGNAVNVTTLNVVFDTAAGYDVGTSTDFIEVSAGTVNTAGVTAPDQTFICNGNNCDAPMTDTHEEAGLVLDGNRITGGDSIDELTSATVGLYQNEDAPSSDSSEDEEDKDSPETINPETVTETEADVETSDAVSPDVKVEARTLNPCGV